jgi:pilus assembly protein CpaB
MRSTRALMMMGAAFIAGLIAVVSATQWINEQAQLGVSKVVVLVMDLQLGSRINPEMLQVVDWPASSVPSGAFQDPKALEGRVVKTTVQRGEPLLESKLAPIGTQGGLSAVVTEGKRAITVRVNDVVGVAGFALPGNYVDILVNTQHDGGKSSGERDPSISKIVLERILVLAVAQEAGRDETKPKVVNAVTLEVTPEQAEKVDLARSVGKLSLVLRNQVDGDSPHTRGARKQDLLQVSAPLPPQKPAGTKVVYRRQPVAAPVVHVEVKKQIEVIKGVNKSVYEY